MLKANLTGFTLIELLVVIANNSDTRRDVVAQPGKGTDRAKRSLCLNNTRRMAIAAHTFSKENKLGAYADTSGPGDDDLTWLYSGKIQSLKSYTCP